MALSMLVIIGLIGLGVIAIIALVVVLITISRRNDFVNPIPIRREESKPSTEVSPDIPGDIKSNLDFHSPDDKEAALVDYLIEQASAQTGINLVGDQMVYQRMINGVRIALSELENQESYQLSLPFLTADSRGPKHFEFTITRGNINQL